MRIILASQSPRRQALLNKIFDEFEIIISEADENVDDYLSPQDFAVKASQRKADAVKDLIADCKNTIIISADTIVVKGNKIFGKPIDSADAERMLKELMEIEHQVITGFSIYIGNSGSYINGYDISNVIIKKMNAEELENYIKFSGCFDKAGAYGIQDMKSFEHDNVTGNTGSFDIVQSYTGSYDNIVGFPTENILKKLREKK